MYYYRRAFTKWDTNYEAQFWFARYAYESTDEHDFETSKEVFGHLREIPLAQETRAEVRDCIGGFKTARVFYGRLVRRYFSHGFVERDGSGSWLFCHKRFATEWDTLVVNDSVQFAIGFSFAGAIALSLEKL
jgi:hypothetical protein